jgi:hypothetical protein
MIFFVTNLFRAQRHQPTIHRCAPHFGRPAAARARPVRMLQAHAHEAARERAISAPAPGPTPHSPRRACLSATPARRHLRWPSARASAPPRLFCLTACALLPRCRQPRLRAVGLDGHRALDISVTTGRRDVDITVTRIRPLSRPRALPHGPGGAKPVPVSRARSSSGLRPRRRTARPAHHQERPRRLRPGHRRHANHGVATPAPPPATGPPHHRLSHETTAHTHPCSTRLHLHRTHLTLTSPVTACHSQPASTPPHPCPS